MSWKNTVSVIEAEGLEPFNAESVQVLRSATVYIWKPVPEYLSHALTRAFSFRYALVKRALDVILSSLLLVLFFPMGLVVAFLVAVTSPGPIFYSEERVGRFRVPFRIYKFRSMYTSSPHVKVLNISSGQRVDPGGSRFVKRVRDPRITPVGRIIRRLSVDELPQLWNVLLGDMSLVGPRPIVESERKLYGRNLVYYDLFCPGITGLWQVSGRSDIDYDKRVLLDREYASRWSCLLDFAILLRTIPAVVTMRGAY